MLRLVGAGGPEVSFASPGRMHGLDGLRALAVTMVVVHNFGPLPGLSRYPRLGSLRAGYVGVTIFFVLSGFLITHLLVQEFVISRRIGLGAFYTRRAVRLLPALTLCVLLLVAISRSLHFPRHEIVVAALAVGAYIFNFVAEHRPVSQPLGVSGWGHLWSLSVEEQYYLVGPIVLVLLLRRFTQRTIMWLLIVAAVAVSVWRTHLWLGGASFFRLYLMTDTRVDALLIGAALALAMRNYPSVVLTAARYPQVLLVGIVSLIVLADFGSSAEPDRSPGWLLGPGMLVVSLISASLVIVAVSAQVDDGPMTRLLDAKIVSAIGRRSYGIYLYHYPILTWVSHHRGGWLLSLALTLAVAEISYRFVEQPLLRRAPRWSRRQALSPTATD
jgi:peptidoglycan/LPS O-acetylase OafA/YrhL